MNIKKEIAKNVIRLLNLVPLRKNKILLISNYGNVYGCNPKYIAEYILKYSPSKYDIVYVLNNTENKEINKEIRYVKINTLRYYYELCTSKIIINNSRMKYLFLKRKSQYYIQTWHSSLRLKQIEKDAEKTLSEYYINMAKDDSKKIDLLLSGCVSSTRILQNSFWYDGEIFEYGMPRNDIFFSKKYELLSEIKNKLNIESQKKILLYAPTFRKNKNLDVYDMDYGKVLGKVSEKFGGEWVLLVKLHPNLLSESLNIIKKENIIDVTTYGDMQELLYISDILISDYSSLMFDFAITKKPCFLYTPDLYEYINSDRKLYFDINELPFISAKNNSELENVINEFDNSDYLKNLNDFMKTIGSFETGHACEELSKRINIVCFGEE